MHRITAPEKHRVRHARTIVVGAGRFAILARVDIRFQDVAEIIYVIAEYGRDVVLVLRDDGVMAGRRAETGFARRNR
jgi:hypothetical protein